ncbi:hypothetical protein SteCoe_12378 [Stentor coeruleus]|uniref:GPI-anchor transamidase n=1 Tax=Stentor coeruleus TaxID=5963 RepID=A0A1R2CAY5_9CILI|nr:hypothetical protein SteCoe_12378 [Stentor coeruleus]
MSIFWFFLLAIVLVKCDDNWAVIISSSKYYYNYRHTVNALLIYQMLKKYGFDDDHIILMLPENHQCHPRNNYPGKIYDGFKSDNLMNEVFVDYRGLEVHPDSIVNLLTGRHSESFPNSKRLNSGPNSKVFIYLTGHAGNGYYKIQDTLVLKSMDIANIVYEMYYKQRFGELMIFIDSCQSFSIYDYIDLPGVHGLSSSLVGQPSKSYGQHSNLGLSTTDQFTYHFTELFRGRNATSIKKMSMENIVKQLPMSLIKSQIGFKSQQKSYAIFIADFITSSYKKPEDLKIEVVAKECEGKIWEKVVHKTQIKFQEVSYIEESYPIRGLLIVFVGFLVFYISNLF